MIILSAADKQFALRNFTHGPGTELVSRFVLSGLDPSGWHSDQGSMFPGIHQDSRSRKKISEYSDRLISTEFWGGTCCDSHLGWRYHICKISPGGVETHFKTLAREVQGQGLKFILSDGKGAWNHTRQYTFLELRTLKSYQAIHLIMPAWP